MNKLFKICIASSVILALSCNRDEVIDVNQDNCIAFEKNFVDNMVKNGGPSVTTGLTEFYIHGIFMKDGAHGTVFDNTRVHYGRDTGGKWAYSPTEYWVQGATYWFKAISLPVGEEPYHLKMIKINPKLEPEKWKTETKFTFSNIGGNQISSGTSGTGSTTVTAEAGDNDLVYATHTRTVSGTQVPVQMQFKHALARIRFSFVNNLASIYSIKVSDISIHNAIRSAELALNDVVSWDVTGSTCDLSMPVHDAAIWKDNKILRYDIRQGETGISGLKYLIPGIPRTPEGIASQYEISFTLEILLDSVNVFSKNFTITLPDIADGLKQAFSYNYVASISMESLDLDKIEFKVQQTGNWEDWTEGTIPIP